MKAVISGSDVLVTIYRAKEHCLETYRASALQDRTAVRQNLMLFKAVHRLWSLINPYHLKGISKKVFAHLNELVCRSVLVADPKQSAQQILHDVELDFGERKSLVFLEFHESIFELLDNSSRSKLCTEYVLLTRKICQCIEEENPFPTLDFHSKLHQVDSPRRSYLPWMKPLISRLTQSRATSPKSSEIPLLLSHDPSPAFERLYKRKTFVIRDPPLSKTAFRQVEILTHSHNSSPHRTWKPHSSRHVIQIPSRRVLGRTEHLLQTSPLSTASRTGRPLSSVLEDIVQDRRRQRAASTLVI